VRAPVLDRRAFFAAGAATLSASGCRPAAEARAAPAALTSVGPSMPARHFPADFKWGVATAAYQIEGAATEDGRGPSIWDVFCKKPGATFQGQTAAIACDHYHRYKEDVALMKALGVDGYRFSISWTRVLPGGRGAVNEKGLDFYKRILDELERVQIAPMVTIFHWDYPQALLDKGGWLSRDSASWFADYASLLVSRLGDRVKIWLTQNEPNVHIALGHVIGTHAPGLKLPVRKALTAAHNAMRAHASAVQAIRAASHGAPPQIGYVIALGVRHPASPSAEDAAAARNMMFRVERSSWFGQAWWLDPVLVGAYPEDGLRAFAGDMPKELEREAPSMKQPLDFLGLNIYSSEACRASATGEPEAVPFPPGYPLSAVDWQPIVPQALYWGPRFVNERYRLPVFITENGLSTRDQLFLDGKVHDGQRVDYLYRVLAELGRAAGDGVPVRGYYHWSMLDNFEWADGYKQRFGLVYVDYQSLRRIPKDSFEFYRQVVASKGELVFGKTEIPITRVTPD
jgi:beta-glucosidase